MLNEFVTKASGSLASHYSAAAFRSAASRAATRSMVRSASQPAVPNTTISPIGIVRNSTSNCVMVSPAIVPAAASQKRAYSAAGFRSAASRASRASIQSM